MLGLPDDITALLFDLDGVLTPTAKIHFKAWKQTFDEFLKAHDGDSFKEFTQDDYNEYVDGMSRFDGVRSFLKSRDIELPEGADDDDGSSGKPTVHGLGNRKNDLVLELIEKDGVEPVSRLAAVRQGGEGGGAGARGRVGERQLPAGAPLGGNRGSVRRDRRRQGGRRAASAGQAPSGHVPGGRPRARRRPVGWRGVRGRDRRRAGRTRRALRLRRRGRPGRPCGRAAAPTGPTSSSRTSPTCCDRTPRLPGRAVDDPRDAPRPRQPGAVRVGVRALQRSHRTAGQPRRGRAVRIARHLHERVLRDPAAAVRRGRLRLPRGRSVRRQRHQRQAHAAAGGGRAVRSALRNRRIPRAGPRPARRAADAARPCGPRRPVAG